MTQSHTVNSELTVTVHSDGTVTWSSAYPMTPVEVCRQIVDQRGKYAERIDKLDQLLNGLIQAMNDPTGKLTTSTIRSILDQSYPAHPEITFTTMAGVVYVKLARDLPPKESAPYIATLAEALEAAGYSCTRSRTRVTVRT